MTVMDSPEIFDRSFEQSLKTDPRWQLVQRIISTPGFVRAPRLVSFLIFVSERSLRGDTQDINEQSIGVGVFGRTSGYDSNDDNIVRSHASRLRQKLETYFHHEGLGETLRVSIPKGSYVPSFYEAPRVHSPDISSHTDLPVHLETYISPDNTVSSKLVSDGHYKQTGNKSGLFAQLSSLSRVPIFYWICALVACLLSIAATYIITINLHHKRLSGVPETNHLLWQQLLDGPQNTLIVSGDSSLVLYENMTGKMLSLADYISGNYRDDVAPQDITDPHMLRTIARRRLTSIVDLDIANRITNRSEFTPDHVALRYARDLHVNDLKGTNVVLIGSQEANPWVQLYSDSLNFTLVPDQQTKIFTIYNRAPKPGEAAKYQSIPGDPERRAYALVSYLRNLDGSGHTLIIQGTGMAGTEAAADYVLGQAELSSLLHAASFPNNTLPNFEILLETSNLNGNAAQSKIVAMRVNER